MKKCKVCQKKEVVLVSETKIGSGVTNKVYEWCGNCWLFGGKVENEPKAICTPKLPIVSPFKVYSASYGKKGEQ